MAISHNRQKVEATHVSTDGWMDKQSVLCIYNRILLILKRKEILTQATTWIRLEDIMLSEITKSKGQTLLYDSPHMRYLE